MEKYFSFILCFTLLAHEREMVHNNEYHVLCRSVSLNRLKYFFHTNVVSLKKSILYHFAHQIDFFAHFCTSDVLLIKILIRRLICFKLVNLMKFRFNFKNISIFLKIFKNNFNLIFTLILKVQKFLP